MNNSIVNKKIGLPRTSVTDTPISYTMQKTTNAWIALAHVTGKPLLSKMVSTNLMLNRTRNVIDLSSGKETSYAPRSHAPEVAEAPDPVKKKEDVAAKV